MRQKGRLPRAFHGTAQTQELRYRLGSRLRDRGAPSVQFQGSGLPALQKAGSWLTARSMWRRGTSALMLPACSRVQGGSFDEALRQGMRLR
jgi:hypothetical protein